MLPSFFFSQWRILSISRSAIQSWVIIILYYYNTQVKNSKLACIKHSFFVVVELFGFYLFIYLFIYGCVGSSLLWEGSLQLRQAGATPHHGARASHHRGPSRRGAQAPDAQAQQPWLTGPAAPGMRDPPRPGLEPASPALAGRLSTTAPSGKAA